VYLARRGESGFAFGVRVPSALKAAVMFRFGLSGSGRGVPETGAGYMPGLNRGPETTSSAINSTNMVPIAIGVNRS
jgi:hypothetical protein